MSAPKRILIMAGGTGGHIIPGLAVAEELRREGWKVFWLGNPQAMEGRLVPVRGFELVPIVFSGLRGKGLFTKLLLPWTLLRACWQAGRVLRKLQPHVVLGMGGYISFPGGLMACLLRIPLVLHEQNSIAGLANKTLAPLARRVLTGFPDTLRRGEWVGNPVRAKICKLPEAAKRMSGRKGPLNILVIGGSLGAQVINETLPQAIALLPEKYRPNIVHQAGEGHLSALTERYREAGVKAHCVAFINDMVGAYAWADVVIARAGASTVSELAAAGIAAVLIPFPFAVDDHQTSNAYFLAQAGAAIVLPQDELRPERLSEIAYMPRSQLQEMARCARTLAKPEAARSTANICKECAR